MEEKEEEEGKKIDKIRDGKISIPSMTYMMDPTSPSLMMRLPFG